MLYNNAKFTKSNEKNHSSGNTPYRLERNTLKGKALYTYADKQKGVVYIGEDNAYQRYKQIAARQSLEQKELEASYSNYLAKMDRVEKGIESTAVLSRNLNAYLAEITRANKTTPSERCACGDPLTRMIQPMLIKTRLFTSYGFCSHKITMSSERSAAAGAQRMERARICGL
jgi:hypothetical protein